MIVQIVGDPKNYKEVEYIIDEKQYKAYFASKALRDNIYEKEGCYEKIILFIPESLLEEKYQRNLESFEKEIKVRGLEDFELIEIPSIGEYKIGEERISYKYALDDVTVFIFLEFIKRKPDKILADVSTGQNVYVFALIESIRRYVTYRQLERILQEPPKLEVKIATYQPITKDVKRAKIEIRPFYTRSFFQLPEAKPDKLHKSNGEKVGKIGERYKEAKSKFRKVQEKLTIAYNSIRYNIPLAFYQILNFEDDIESLEESMVDFVKEYLRSEVSVDLREVSNVFFSIAMFKSFKEFRNSLFLSEAKVSEIKDKFSEVYKNVGLDLNSVFLERDITEIEDATKNRERLEWRPLIKLYKEKVREMGGSKDKKRNFFAHSGFLKEYTEIKVSNREIYLRWNSEKIEEIKKWLLRPKS